MTAGGENTSSWSPSVITTCSTPSIASCSTPMRFIICFIWRGLARPPGIMGARTAPGPLSLSSALDDAHEEGVARRGDADRGEHDPHRVLARRDVLRPHLEDRRGLLARADVPEPQHLRQDPEPLVVRRDDADDLLGDARAEVLHRDAERRLLAGLEEALLELGLHDLEAHAGAAVHGGVRILRAYLTGSTPATPYVSVAAWTRRCASPSSSRTGASRSAATRSASPSAPRSAPATRSSGSTRRPGRRRSRRRRASPVEYALANTPSMRFASSAPPSL